VSTTSQPHTMEVEDPLSAKFRTLIEGLMVTTTSEIVKIFSKVLLETRVEITRSWREIDLLKQHLEESEQQKRDAIFRAQMGDFKREDDEMEVSRDNSLLGIQSSNTLRPGDVVSGFPLVCSAVYICIESVLIQAVFPKNKTEAKICPILVKSMFLVGHSHQFVILLTLTFLFI